MAGAFKRLAVAVAVALAGISSAWAQDSNQELKKEVDTLKAKVAALEAENPNAAKAGLPVSVSSDAPAKPAEEKTTLMDGINTWVKDVALSAFVDVGYVYNFAHPRTNLNGNTGFTPPAPAFDGSSVRCFDKQANEFYLHMAQIMFDKPVSDKSIVGGRIKLAFGQDADVISSNGSTSGDNFDIEEGYIQILAPLGKGVTFTAGKFATLAGSEVIESKDNLNYSRSLLFTWAIPFTHTGIRAQYSVTDQLDLRIGINNGCDQLADNNASKTLEFEALFKATDSWTVILNLYYGSEKDTNGTPVPGTPGDKRLTVDFVVSGTIDKLTVGFNWDWAMEQDSIATATGTDDANWTGAAAYLKYQLDPKYAPGVRIEYFRDSDGFRTGTKQTLVDVTLTNQFDVIENVIMRFEVRFDKSTEEIFLSNSKEKKSEVTVGFEVIWMFK